VLPTRPRRNPKQHLIVHVFVDGVGLAREEGLVDETVVFAEAPGCACGVEHHGVVHEAVEDCCCADDVTERHARRNTIR
jgi:hypothetical protein